MKRIYGVESALAQLGRLKAEVEKVYTDGKGLYSKMLTPAEFAAHVIRDTIREGDEAILRISESLDGCPLGFIEVPKHEMEKAASKLSAEVMSFIEMAAERVYEFHKVGLMRSWEDPSREFGEMVNPVARAGVYIPGGSAPLLSTVIMCAVPAKAAGVNEVFISTPAKGDELPHPAILAAAKLIGVESVFKVGGAQAIAAFAYGTKTIPQVDLVCGPGNVFVNAAKRLVVGDVGIDGIYGPTETMIIADSSANPAWVAADLIAQAEHDNLAAPILIALSLEVADAVESELQIKLSDLPRKDIAQTALRQQGCIVIVDTPEEARLVARAYAPEHLSVMISGTLDKAEWSKGVGGLFIGEYSAEILGDYIAGPSHVMPTGGTARFASALSTRHFLKTTPFISMSRETFHILADAARSLARTEGLEGHARAAEVRLQ